MPCSALIEPPSSATRRRTASSTAVVVGVRADHVHVEVAVAEMAEEVGRRGPVDGRHRASTRPMNAGHRAERQRDVELVGHGRRGRWPRPCARGTPQRAAGGRRRRLPRRHGRYGATPRPATAAARPRRPPRPAGAPGEPRRTGGAGRTASPTRSSPSPSDGLDGVEAVDGGPQRGGQAPPLRPSRAGRRGPRAGPGGRRHEAQPRRGRRPPACPRCRRGGRPGRSRCCPSPARRGDARRRRRRARPRPRATWARMAPWRSTRTPPALVAAIPPTVAVSRAARSTPKASPASRAWA